MELCVKVEIPFDQGREMTCRYAPVLGEEDLCPYYKPQPAKGVLSALLAPATATCGLFGDTLEGVAKCDRCKLACMDAIYRAERDT